jgi:hypothetical protein
VKLLTGYGWGSSDPHTVFTACLRIYLYLICKVCSYLVNQTKIIFSRQKRKPSFPSRSNTLCFYQLTTPHTTSLTRLCYSTASVSHPVPLSAANRLKADSHYTSRFRSVTVPSSFRQIGLCSHCPSCSPSGTARDSRPAFYLHQICSFIRFVKDSSNSIDVR